MSKCIAPFGAWPSAIDARRVAAGAKPLAEPRIDGETIHWLEGRAEEGGRVVVMRAERDGTATTMTPAPFNVRSRVHEYGGGAYLVADGTIYFSNFADNRVYAQRGSMAPQPLTQSSAHRFADFELDTARRRLLAVREDHSVAGREARNTLVAIALDVNDGQIELAAGADFYAAPRLSPGGRQLAWLSWNHPLMPFNGTELWLADVQGDGGLAHARKIAGSDKESLCQPVWSPGGTLYVVSDRTGWWNLYRVDGAALQPVLPMQAEFGQPLWVFAQAMYGFTHEDEIIATYIEQGVSRLVRIDLASGSGQPMPAAATEIDELRATAGFAVALAGSPTTPMQVVRIDGASSVFDVLATSVDELPEGGDLAIAESMSYPSAGGRTAHAFFYPPCNGDYEGVAGTLPPLLVMSHGGPTSMSTNSLRLSTQFWTSRGFAVLDVNYGGSTGFGRAYMDLLRGQWGMVDVEDCVAGARYLAQQGRVDAQRMAIRGGSAGGFTTLSALAFHNVFKAGASHFGVSDLAGLDDDTHKFESRYNTYLIAPPPERERLYRERSPVHHADKLSCPMIFFQGLDDRVVVPAQSEVMVQALQARGIPVAYLAFEGEGHGFRRRETIQRALEAELYFYGKVFGFEPADRIEPVPIQGLA